VTPTNKDAKDGVWIATRGDIVCSTFKTRKEAVTWFKELLKQTLKDYENQDKTNEFNYEISIKLLNISYVKYGPTWLWLIIWN